MRTMLLLGALIAGASFVRPLPSHAQERDRERRPVSALPADVASSAIDLYNAPATTRASGSLDVSSSQRIVGDLVVLHGPLVISGEVTGRVVVINGDLILRPGARIGGDVLVLGGVSRGWEEAVVGGDIQSYAHPLAFREEVGGDRIEAIAGGWQVRIGSRDRERRTRSSLRLFSAGPYNRVEGLPILLGPSWRHRDSWGSARVEALAIVRTADNLRVDSEHLGHRVTGEVRLGGDRALTLGGRLYNQVDASDEWQLKDTEVSLASFFFRRDYRDYYGRHGGGAHLTVHPGRDVGITVGVLGERWGSREDRNAFTLFRSGEDWRQNPRMDEGRFTISNGTLRIDTRSSEHLPWSGWYVTADYEFGAGSVTGFAPTAGARQDAPADSAVRYHRGFLDLRRYNRISPDAQLNLRIVIGGWLGGDELPVQRRLGVGGPGSLPGYRFRQFYDDVDPGMCAPAGSPLPGRPALCERIALAQVEYRGDLTFGMFERFSDRWYSDVRERDIEWVAFMNAGRGWLVGERIDEISYPAGGFPSLDSFRTDIGLGLDLGLIGFYIAQPLSHAGEPLNFFVRLRHRF